MESVNSEASNPLLALSQSLGNAVERVSPAIVAVHARPRVPTSGVIWRPGVVVSTNHTVERDEELAVMMHDGRKVSATLAGRDPGTDLAVLRLEEDASASEHQVAPIVGDASHPGVGAHSARVRSHRRARRDGELRHHQRHGRRVADMARR
ncbi:MAG: trypsin-like peptidase domain-containing protein [Pyrinomonadaceae bacterium]